MAWDKGKTNIAVDLAAGIAFIMSLISGVILWLVLPSGSGFGGGRNIFKANHFLSLSRHGWLSVHIVFSLAAALLIGYHLVLHRFWIKKIPGIMEK